MATRHEIDEADIRRRIDALVEGIRAKDLAAVAPIYAPDIVSFDIEPPLRHVGAGAKQGNWVKAFAAYEGPLGYDVRDLTVAVGDGLAFTHCLARISGSVRAGGERAYWVRWTACFRKFDGIWFITHDQVSVPVDFKSGDALLDLEP